MVIECWNIPSGTFLNQFALKHDKNSISIYLPEPQISSLLIKSHLRQISSIDSAIEKVIPINYRTTASIQSHEDIPFRDQDLHVYISNENDIKSNIQTFIDIFNNRTNSRREHWMLDITFLNFDDIQIELSALHIDLDDDLFLYRIKDNNDIPNTSISNQDIELFEAYKIHQDFPIEILYNGEWLHKNSTLSVDETEKWVRRRDLNGVTFQCNTLPSMPYVTKMEPIVGKNGEFEMEGMFAEVFFALQVNLSYLT